MPRSQGRWARARRMALALVVLAGLWSFPAPVLMPPALSQEAKRAADPAPAASPPRSKKDLLKAWEQGAAKLQSYDVYLSAESKGFLDPSQDWKPRAVPSVTKDSLHQVYSRGKLRFEPGVDRPGQMPAGTVVTWDGKRATIDNRALGGDSDDAVRYVKALSDALSSPLDYEGLYRSVEAASLIEMLRERPWTKVERREGDQFILVTPTTLGKSYQYSPFGLRVWLDSRRNFLPTKIQFLSPEGDEEFLYYELELTLKEVAAGVWAPVKAVCRHYPPKVQTVSPPVMSAEDMITVDLKNSRFNVAIPEATFRAFPPVAGEAKADAEDDDREPARGAMQVTVLGPDKKPVAGARIHAGVWTDEPFPANQDYVCDAEGKVTVRLPKTIDILRLWASQEGHVGLFAQWWPKQEARPRTIPREYTFHLEKGSVLGGVVKNDDGEPIAGARVQVTVVDDNRKPGRVTTHPIPTDPARGGEARTTDARGRWTLDNAPAGAGFSFRVMLNHPDYVSDYQRGGLQDEQNVSSESFRAGTAEILMHRGVALSGVVTDADGKKVPGAVVIWGDDPYQQEGSQEVRSDAEGRYRFPPLPAGPLKVTVVARDWAPDQKSIQLAPDDATLNFKLKQGQTLRLHFVDDQGNDIPEMGVSIQGWRNGRALYNHRHPAVLDTGIPVQANEDGIFEWTWAPGDEVTYSVYKAGYQDARNLNFTADGGDGFEIRLPTMGNRQPPPARKK